VNGPDGVSSETYEFQVLDSVRSYVVLRPRGMDAGTVPTIIVRLITVADVAHSWPGTAHVDHIAQFGASGSFNASQAHWDFVHEVDHG
jgi:hypothetical protein